MSGTALAMSMARGARRPETGQDGQAMTISGIGRTAAAPYGCSRASQNDAAAPAHALVPVAPVLRTQAPHRQPRAARPDAAFVTQLIATAAQIPQTRALRRASPADALASYAGRTVAHGAASSRVVAKTA
jgi:hypothetical protein